jgi:hypothetical protein
MEIRFTKRVGDIEFEITDTAEKHEDLFDVVEFWSSLPSVGPNGETDLRFAHRVAQDYHFYEIVSPSAQMRFCFGQRKQGKGLFPKGWQPVVSSEHDEHEQSHQPQRAPRNVDEQIRAEFARLGVQNVGQEKAAIMKALNLRTGMILQELEQTEKEDLLAFLIQQQPKAKVA